MHRQMHRQMALLAYQASGLEANAVTSASSCMHRQKHRQMHRCTYRCTHRQMACAGSPSLVGLKQLPSPPVHRQLHRQTDAQTHAQPDAQTDAQTCAQTDGLCRLTKLGGLKQIPSPAHLYLCTGRCTDRCTDARTDRWPKQAYQAWLV